MTRSARLLVGSTIAFRTKVHRRGRKLKIRRHCPDKGCPLSAPRSNRASTKGIFFTFAVLVVFLILAAFGYRVIPLTQALLTPLFGFLVGLMFGTMSMFVTSFVKVINHFNFYFTGLLSPMFFFSGVVFPLSQLPRGLQWFAELVPLTHPTRLVRGLCAGRYDWIMLADLAYILGFIAVMGLLAVRRLQKRMIR